MAQTSLSCSGSCGSVAALRSLPEIPKSNPRTKSSHKGKWELVAVPGRPFPALHGLPERFLARQEWNLATRGLPTPQNGYWTCLTAKNIRPLYLYQS